MIRVLLVDDESMFLEAVQALLEGDDRVQIVAATQSALRALELVSNLREMSNSLRANAERVFGDVQRVHSSLLAQIERRVCRVELEGNAVGTGFLVGPDTVLTNWHVFEAAKNQGKIDALGCRFDYELLPDGKVQPGQLIMLQAGGLVPYIRRRLERRV